jgi:TctA family transporter
VQQHTLLACFIGYTRDGRISRAYEYFGTGQIEKFVGPRPQRGKPI